MNCRKVRSRLSQYVDGELGRDEIEAVGEHLRACPSCGEELRKLEVLKEAFLSLGEVEPPSGFWWGVRSKIYGEDVPTSPARRPLKWAVLGAGIAVVAAVLIFGSIHWGNSEDDYLDAWLTEVTYRDEPSYWTSVPIENFRVEDVFVENWLASKGYNTPRIREVLYSSR